MFSTVQFADDYHNYMYLSRILVKALALYGYITHVYFK